MTECRRGGRRECPDVELRQVRAAWLICKAVYVLVVFDVVRSSGVVLRRCCVSKSSGACCLQSLGDDLGARVVRTMVLPTSTHTLTLSLLLSCPLLRL